jgi:hypothetical protein
MQPCRCPLSVQRHALLLQCYALPLLRPSSERNLGSIGGAGARALQLRLTASPRRCARLSRLRHLAGALALPAAGWLRRLAQLLRGCSADAAASRAAGTLLRNCPCSAGRCPISFTRCCHSAVYCRCSSGCSADAAALLAQLVHCPAIAHAALLPTPHTLAALRTPTTPATSSPHGGLSAPACSNALPARLPARTPPPPPLQSLCAPPRSALSRSCSLGHPPRCFGHPCNASIFGAVGSRCADSPSSLTLVSYGRRIVVIGSRRKYVLPFVHASVPRRPCSTPILRLMLRTPQ